MEELQKFLTPGDGGEADGDKAPPNKKARLDDSDGCPAEEAQSAETSGAPKTCNLCLGILQHLSDAEFVKKVIYTEGGGYND